jgi:uncharacterized protein (TIGR02246 family)
MTVFIRFRRTATLGALVSALALAPALLAQATPKTTAGRDTGHVRLDTAAILASARPEIEAANAAWVPGLKQHDAKSIAAPYADSGLFIAGNGTVTRGREAVARMYEGRFPKLRPIRAGGIVQDGLAVLAPTRIVEWGHGWLEMDAEGAGAPPVRSGGSYVTVWERQADGHWRIVRNMAF